MFPHYVHRITMGRLLHKYGNHVFTTSTILLAHSNLEFMVNDYPTSRAEPGNKDWLMGSRAAMQLCVILSKSE